MRKEEGQSERKGAEGRGGAEEAVVDPGFVKGGCEINK